MSLIVVGLSHKTAPVEVRELLAFPGPALEAACTALSGHGVAENILLSTCNRVEVYAVTDNTDTGFSGISTFLSERAGGGHLITPHLYHYSGTEAIGHLFQVAASLDSMVVGEPQILGQFKDAYEAALAAGSTGMVLNKVAKKAISVAKRVRTETRIAESAVSISFAAVELARKVFGNLEHHRVMLVGAGEMAELALQHLKSAGVSRIDIANRTTHHAERLASELGGEVVPFSEFPERMAQADIVICSTGAPDYVIGSRMMADVIRARKNRPVFLFDISVPRNIDPEVNRLDNVFLYDIDDLQAVVDANMDQRMAEARKAEIIIEEEVAGMARWFRSLDVVPTIAALREQADQIREAEVARALSRLSHLSERDQELVRGLGAAIVNKLLHTPFTTLRREAQENDGRQMVETTRKLFALTPGTSRKPAQDGSQEGDKEQPLPEQRTG